MNYTYDGTFFGFMSALFAAYADGITRVGTIGESAETSLFGDCKYIPTEADKAGRVLTGLKNRCGEKAVFILWIFVRYKGKGSVIDNVYSPCLYIET